MLAHDIPAARQRQERAERVRLNVRQSSAKTSTDEAREETIQQLKALIAKL